jgi:hypothetical protein
VFIDQREEAEMGGDMDTPAEEGASSQGGGGKIAEASFQRRAAARANLQSKKGSSGKGTGFEAAEAGVPLHKASLFLRRSHISSALLLGCFLWWILWTLQATLLFRSPDSAVEMQRCAASVPADVKLKRARCHGFGRCTSRSSASVPFNNIY